MVLPSSITKNMINPTRLVKVADRVLGLLIEIFFLFSQLKSEIFS